MPKLTLDGVEVKLLMARRHAHVLIKEIMEFTVRHQDDYRFVGEVYDQGHRHVYRIVDQPPLPRHWSGLVGDFAHNLRAALDHLAWQLVKLNGHNPNTRTAFPLWEAKYRYVNGTKVAMAVNPPVSAAAWAEIEAVQPYNANRGDLRNSRLHWLRELDNADKHRHLIVTAGAVRGAGFPGVNNVDTLKIDFTQRPFKNGDIVLVVTFPGPHLEPDVDLRCAAHVVLGEGAPKWLVGFQVWPMLELIYGDVEQTIDRFRPMFGVRPLGIPREHLSTDEMPY